ncbi:hypothetical protein OO007_11280 [Cocleimonas sp. KMM 6892]|uniref:hypothetical protein n=1 Tax=unclassified Cocleimonas TaxID=2639732 RepID=UPI002DB812B3|nr:MULTISPECIES: hypothetical protein [unclassified Cocleimonas]MEB8432812.1 hypothetical protein [Cocleimonas sp. KMM 6892]MEC4715671.1 hypothetical protein [Cocleimonas sp. KMM 6895]MEC4744711.1 hypothetical protein [Cocleimonas sp. KMM 6896]
MKAILITIALSAVFLFILKANVSGSGDQVEKEKAESLVRTVEVKCAVAVNGMIRGGLPPCDMFPDKKSNKKKYKPPYVVDDIAYKNYNDFSNKMMMKQNAQRDAYVEYKNQYQQDLNEYHETQHEIAYASTRKKVAERDAKNAAYLAKKEETKMLRKKGQKAKSRVMKCKRSSGETYYSNGCSGNKAEKELRIVKLPKQDYQHRSTYRADKTNEDKLASTIIYKEPKEKQYSSNAERERATRKYYEKMFNNSGFSKAEVKRKVDKYVNETMSLYR